MSEPQIGRANASAELNQKPVAAMLRENEILRSVAEAAIRLRHIGRLQEEQQATLEEFWENNPHVTRSLTHTMMLETAFKSALEAFDKTVEDAALAQMDWATGWKRPLTRVAADIAKAERP